MTAQTKTPVLVLDSISKHYAENRHTAFAINNFSLNINAGDLVRLHGKSGSGKTTILRIAGLLTQPDTGTVTICGQTPRTENQRDRTRSQNLGIVFQENCLFKHLTLTQNLRVADLAPYDPARYSQLLTHIGINHLADVKAARLSGGELQRAGICRAIINNPKLLLLDEPTSALDDEATASVLRVIQLMQQKGVAILLASHDQRLNGIETQSVSLQ